LTQERVAELLTGTEKPTPEEVTALSNAIGAEQGVLEFFLPDEKKKGRKNAQRDLLKLLKKIIDME
jgi:hypothetical protein